MDGRLNIFKISIFPNLVYRSNAVPIKILPFDFVDLDKLILKVLGHNKRDRIAKKKY